MHSDELILLRLDAIFKQMGQIGGPEKVRQDIIGLIRECELLFQVHAEKILIGSDQPWPLSDVLNKLIEASEILLNEKNYDGHGWEEILHAVNRAKEIVPLCQLAALRDIKSKQNS